MGAQGSRSSFKNNTNNNLANSINFVNSEYQSIYADSSPSIMMAQPNLSTRMSTSSPNSHGITAETVFS
jgi:hypothetical protein